ELAVPDQTELRAEIYTLLSRMQRTVTGNLREQRLALEQLTQKSVLKNPNLYFDTKRMQLLAVSTQFDKIENEILHRARVRLQENAAKLQALSPLSVLARGYSVTALSDGTVVTSTKQLSVNTEVTVQVADGKAACTVKEIL
ncbi:MAG: exodeoxyribonuclease VII large subunit, partial [Candidatus Fimenecus sp.]